MSKQSRVFIAFSISYPDKLRLFTLRHQLQVNQLNCNWVSLPKLHLTLSFLGSLSKSELESVVELVNELRLDLKEFQLNWRGVSAFPSKKRARVLILKLGGQDIKKLNRLVANLKTRLQKLEINFERKKFMPHITLGRFKAPVNLQKLKTGLQNGQEIWLKDLGVFESQLLKNGSKYRRIRQMKWW